jgi:hypothetical protein
MIVTTDCARVAISVLFGIAYDARVRGGAQRARGAMRRLAARRPSPFMVSDASQAFHDNIARRLYIFHVEKRTATWVVRALTKGPLMENEAPNKLVAEFGRLVEFYRSELPSMESRSRTV